MRTTKVLHQNYIDDFGKMSEDGQAIMDARDKATTKADKKR